MKIKPSTEIMLDDFLKLPRHAQLMFFDKMNCSISKDNPYLLFDVIGFDLEMCKSPIEQILFFAFNIRAFERTNEFIDIYMDLEPQKEIVANGKKYYADLFFDYETSLMSDDVPVKEFKLVIECDGHNYHHATKKQVSDDYKRETNIKLAGYDVLRFTGSQIYEDPYKCADTIIDYILSRTKETS